VHEGLISTTLRTLSNNYALVEEPWQALASFDPFALPNQEPCTPALARRVLLPYTASAFTREAEDARLPTTFRALGPDHAFEVTFLGPRVMLNGQVERNHSAGGTARRREHMMIV
jgi:hypothetical protein